MLREFFNDVGKVWVVIKDHKEIPFLGRGPINRPIKISEENYEILKNLGYNITPIDVNDSKFEFTSYVINPLRDTKINIEEIQKIESNECVITPNIDEKVTDEVKNTILDDVTLPNNVEVELPKQENEIEDIEDTNKEKVSIEDLTKKELKALLDENKIKYNYNDNLDVLRNKVKENNLL